MPTKSIVAIDKMCRLLEERAEAGGMKLTFSEKGEAKCNRVEVTLPMPSTDAPKEELDRIYAAAIHECGHLTRPEAFDILEKIRPPEVLSTLFNIVEDDGLERELAEKWAGDKKILSESNKYYIEGSIGRYTEPPPPDADLSTIVAMMLARVAALDWDSVSGPTVTTVIGGLHEDIQAKLQDVIDKGFVERFRETEGPVDTWNVALDLMKEFYPDLEEELEDRKTTSEELAAMSSPGEGEDKGKGVAGDGDSEGKGDPLEIRTDTLYVPIKDAVKSKHNPDGTPAGVGEYTTDPKRGKLFLAPPTEFGITDCSEPGRQRAGEFPPTSKASHTFGNRVRRYLQAETKRKIDPEKHSGRLDKASLIRLGLPPIDGGDYNKRVFYQPRKSLSLDTSISMLIDFSGSMRGGRPEKVDVAVECASELNRVFSHQLALPVAITTFTQGATSCDIGLVKKFKERRVPDDDLRGRLGYLKMSMWGNNDSDAVAYAFRQLVKQKTARRVLMVFSDGCPTDSWRGRASINLKTILQDIDKDPSVDLFGIGINSNHVRDYYRNYIVVNNISELPHKMFELLRDSRCLLS